MNCAEWEERVALYAGGDLGAEEAATVERHVGECTGCQVFLSGLTQGLAVLREAHGETALAAAGAAVRARVMARLERGRRGVWKWAFGMAGGAVVAAAVWVAMVVARPVPPVAAPRVAAARAPEVAAPRVAAAVAAPARRAARRVRPAIAKEEAEPAKPVMVKLVTDDPDVVIYWITGTTGEIE